MRTWRASVVTVTVISSVLFAPRGVGQVEETFSTAPIVTAGLGVLYFNPQDVVNTINGSGLAAGRAEDFKAYAEFFGCAAFPLSRTWVLMAHYAYILGSYNLPGIFGPGEFTCTIHAPSVLLLYALWQEPLFAIRGGVGAGYHFGALHARAGTLDDTYRGKGPGFLLNLDGNTALGDRLSAYLGLFARWEAIGELTDEAGKSLEGPQGLPAPTLYGFGVGAKLGVSYMF
jgi:hypothetical protein